MADRVVQGEVLMGAPPFEGSEVSIYTPPTDFSQKQVLDKSCRKPKQGKVT